MGLRSKNNAWGGGLKGGELDFGVLDAAPSDEAEAESKRPRIAGDGPAEQGSRRWGCDISGLDCILGERGG
jgi:hypothetical protein